MRRASISLVFTLTIPLLRINAQGVTLKRTLIDSFTTSNRVGPVRPAFNRERIYYVINPDTLVLYDIAAKRSRQIGVGQWTGLSVARTGDLLAFSRTADGSKTSYVWTLPLDPATGLPTGPARRTSMSPGARPGISSDGKWIAFAADSDRKRLTVIPVNGGRERDLLHGPGSFSDILWASDDAQLFYTCTKPKEPSHDVVQRIAATGGAPVTIDDGDVSFGGVSPDGTRLVVYGSSWPWRDPIVLDPKGREIPANALDSAGLTPSRSWLSDTRALDWNFFQPSALMSMPIGGGTPREVIPGSVRIGRVYWSPDGTRFAAMHSRDKAELIIAKADGANRRIVLLPSGICCASLAWSPDGRSIMVNGWDTQRGRIVIVDATTGTARVPPTSGFGLDSPHWKSDSKHLLYFSGEISDSGDLRSIRETSIDGPDHLVRELPRRFDGGSVFASDTTAIAVSDSATYLFSLTSPRSVRLYQYQGGAPTVSPHGDLIVTRPPQRDATGGARRTAEVISLTGGHVATVTFPGIIGFGVLDHFIFTPDQRSIIGTGRDPTGKCCVVYQGFLDGTPAKTIVGESSSDRFKGLSLSPDGKTLLYTTTGPWIVTFTSVEVVGGTKPRPRN